jgi:hypothetical protein
MTLEEKAGLMLIDTIGPGCGGALTAAATRLIETQKMVRFILRNVVKATADPCDGSVTPARNGFVLTPRQIADFTNAVQELAESQRLGIPVLFKDNARNHYETDPRFGISAGAGAFTEFPKEAGIAAAALGVGDMSPVRALTEVMSREWRAIGLRGMYGYMADLATEPRWHRVQETFTEDADLNADIMKALVTGLQGGPVSPSTAVALTIKHFPGGGPQELGLDPHYSFGKRQVYPGGRFEYHLKPFIAAIDAGVSSVMPYYGVPIDVTYQGVTYGPDGLRLLERDRDRPVARQARVCWIRQLRYGHHQRPRVGTRATHRGGTRGGRHQWRHRHPLRIQLEHDHHGSDSHQSCFPRADRRGRSTLADRAVQSRAVRESLRGCGRGAERHWECVEPRKGARGSEAVDRSAAEPEPAG